MFDDRVYKRGALLLHALRRTIGDEPFFGLLRTWADRHRHGTVTTEMFVALAAEVAGRDLGDVFDPWLSGTGLRSCRNDETRCTVLTSGSAQVLLPGSRDGQRDARGLDVDEEDLAVVGERRAR